MANRSEKKVRTRHTLIEAALRLGAAHGFAGVSLREVTREAGTAPTTFYRHFSDMDDLGLALVDEIGLSLRHLMRQARQQAARKKSRVRASVETLIEFIHKNGNLYRLLLGERSGSSPRFRKAIREEMNRFVGELGEDLERAGLAAKRPLIDPRLTAEAIVAVVFTVGAEALELPQRERMALAERIIKEVRIILRGAEEMYAD